MFRAIILPIFRSTRLCVTACGTMHPRCYRTEAGNIVVMQISDNEIYLLIKYIKSVLWRVAKRLSYIEDAQCLKVNIRHICIDLKEPKEYRASLCEVLTSLILCRRYPFTYSVKRPAIDVSRNIEAHSFNHCWSGKAISNTYSESVFCSLRYSVWNEHAPCFHLWLALLYHVFPHYFTKDTIFEERYLT